MELFNLQTSNGTGYVGGRQGGQLFTGPLFFNDGHFAQPVDDEDSQIDLNLYTVPSSQGPANNLPRDFAPVSPNDGLDEDIVNPSVQAAPAAQDTARRSDYAAGSSSGDKRAQAAAERSNRRSSLPPRPANSQGNPAKKQRQNWETWQTEWLCEFKKIENEEMNGLVGRENLQPSEERWSKVQERLAEKGIHRSISQIQRKWEGTLAKYKKIRDWGFRSGVAPYSELTQEQRKEADLDPNYPESVFMSIHSCYKDRPVMNPPCMQNSMPAFGRSVETPPSPMQRPTTPIPSDTERSPSETLSDVAGRANSGRRKKKDMSRSSAAVVDAVDKLGSSLVAVEEKRGLREVEHQKFMQIHMVARTEQDQRQHAEMVNVFKTMADAFMLMAQHRYGSQKDTPENDGWIHTGSGSLAQASEARCA
ncbi:hypothetical protein R1sor_005168 [Riccia sorocarpa]|uniref:Myb/SANT-like DNA-binding domain-containing protein n=1 Tax=Riccia sorocarpa TaxID=122646 RepID=A0ABD3HJ13_9MARC